MPRYPSRYASQSSSFSFGPGPISTALKLIIAANVVLFLTKYILPGRAVQDMTETLGLVPGYVVQKGWIWQLFTYMFVHAGPMHLLFNMLTLWMFGTELERIWGTKFFVKFYFVTGIGAGLLTLLASLLPFRSLSQMYGWNIVGASGAIYGLLLAYAVYFPNRLIYMYLVFPIPSRLFVVIMGALAFLTSMSANGGGVASATHLGGLLVAYVYLKGLRVRLSPWAEVKYRYVKWKIGRARKKFDVYSGGRSGEGENNRWDRRVH
jgi:membrane associated rhomboid family serine protease